MYDVICVGSATVDTFASTKFSELVKISDGEHTTNLLAYPTGGKILVDELNFTTGGGGTNVAVSFARLGHKVACISKMGNGANAKKVLQHLKKEKIDTSLMVQQKNARTGFSIILDSLEHDRTILSFKGSNNHLKFSDINKNKLKTKWFFFCTMLEDSWKTTEKLAKYAEQNNIKIGFNASSYLAKQGIEYCKEVLKRCDVFAVNLEEAELMTGKSKLEEQFKVLTKYSKIVLITDSKRAAYASDGKYLYTMKSTSIKPLETTGAGDSFASTFVSGMIRKNDIQFALHLARSNAESVIQYHGAKNKLLTLPQAKQVMKKYPKGFSKKLLK